MVAAGIDQAGIASVLGIGEAQMRRHYRRELANGYASITARIAARQIAKADAGDERAIEFYLERRGGWVRKDNVAVANADDKPFKVEYSWAEMPPPEPTPE
jgi:hypothetical protein